MKIDGNEISKEALAKAMLCDTPEELVKENGVGLTAQEAEAFLTGIGYVDPDSSPLKDAAGGDCRGHRPGRGVPWGTLTAPFPFARYIYG